MHAELTPQRSITLDAEADKFLQATARAALFSMRLECTEPDGTPSFTLIYYDGLGRHIGAVHTTDLATLALLPHVHNVPCPDAFTVSCAELQERICEHLEQGTYLLCL